MTNEDWAREVSTPPPAVLAALLPMLDFKPLRTNVLRSEGIFGRALRISELESGT